VLESGFSAEALPLIEKFWGEELSFLQGVKMRVIPPTDMSGYRPD